VDGKAGAPIVSDGIKDQPGEGVVPLEHVSEHICGEVAVQRMSTLPRSRTKTIISTMGKVGNVDVQGGLEEHRAHGL